ncbi:uncharacterized protein LOC117101348 [Anneissia japonica]|uniref:uncharacterized protein LOC117101348 n=1 Tax=Anneissia japonica TaxID=1529436 RepID=UPI001425A55D|nr:uncharacterized protein LOC117101348 [Anneissia japonica]XP_033097314.1 uncharacterized protein LOC117101348 [Anneissia japonica]
MSNLEFFLLTVVLPLSMQVLKVSYGDEEVGLCIGQNGGVHSCANQCGKRQDNSHQCNCDDMCVRYGDCCLDFHLRCNNDYQHGNDSLPVLLSQELETISNELNVRPLYSCESNPDAWNMPEFPGLLMISSCHPWWKGTRLEKQCAFGLNTSHPVVYVTAKKTFFRNEHCALCNDASILESQSDFSLFDFNMENQLVDQIKYTINHAEPRDVRGLPFIRSCDLDIVDDCPVQTRDDLRYSCKGYSAVFNINGIIYKNPHCAMCNWVYPFWNMTCPLNESYDPWEKPMMEATRPLSELFAFSGSAVAFYPQPVTVCSNGTFYDQILDKCVRCENGTMLKITKEMMQENGTFITLPAGNDGADSTEVFINLNNYLSESFYSSLSDSSGQETSSDSMPTNALPSSYGNEKFICLQSCEVEPTEEIKSNRTTHNIDKRTTEHENVSHVTCKILKPSGQKPPVSSTSDVLLSYISNILLSISLVCLLLSFINSCILPSLRNLPGICRMCLITALFCAQFMFIVFVDKTNSPTLCAVIAAVMHYFWLSIFTWTNVLAFDLARVFVFDTNRVHQSRSIKLLVIYMLYGWGLPLLIVLPCVGLHVTSPRHFRYGGSVLCWIQDKRQLFYSFALPLAVCLILNFGQFMFTSYKIMQARKISNFALGVKMKKSRKFDDVLLYIKISCLMGFTWGFAFVASYANVAALWYIFILLNGLQGFFIFIAFTCNRHVLKLWRERLQMDKESQTQTTRCTRFSTQKITSRTASITRADMNASEFKSDISP